MSSRLPVITVGDIDAMARTLYGEARGSTREDRIACAWVMRNRAVFAADFKRRLGRNHPLFGDGSVRSACLAPWQFSCWNQNDPNRVLLDGLGKSETPVDGAFLECLDVATMVLTGRVADPTQGSRHYHTLRMGWPRSWGEPRKPVVTIGAHAFYNNVL